jgi:hypothetical protein
MGEAGALPSAALPAAKIAALAALRSTCSNSPLKKPPGTHGMRPGGGSGGNKLQAFFMYRTPTLCASASFASNRKGCTLCVYEFPRAVLPVCSILRPMVFLGQLSSPKFLELRIQQI